MKPNIFVTIVFFMVGTVLAKYLGFGLEWQEIGLVCFYLVAFSITCVINGSVKV